MFARPQLPIPLKYTAKVQSHERVRIVEYPHNPWVGWSYVDAELFVQFTRQSRADRLVGLNLAARKFPVRGVWFSGRATRQQEPAIGPNQHPGRDVDRRARLTHLAVTLFASFFVPAQWRANCNATRPERDPRCSANCNASARA